jgi:hypothetical protein
VNSFLKKLGYSPDDRVAIVHADDVGMCQASLSAFIDLVEFGLVSSGSTIVPCPWFPSVVDFCRANPEVDMGVHDAGIYVVNFRALRAQIYSGGTGSRHPFTAAQQTKRRHMPRRMDKAGWDFTKPWYHGSPKALDVLRAGSTITQDRELARAFSHKPTLVSVDDAGEARQIKHNGHELGFLYCVAEEITSEDVTPHPRSAIEFGKEWLTGRALRLTLIEPTQPVREEMLTVEEIEALRQGRVKA